MSLLAQRWAISRSFERPSRCNGCISNPESNSKFNPLLCGAFIEPRGDLTDSLLIAIGISGGDDEERMGKPFVGPSGRKIERALLWAFEELGWTPGESAPPSRRSKGRKREVSPRTVDGSPLTLSSLPVAYMNVMNCRALKVGLQGKVINRTPPTVAEMRSCAERWLFPVLSKTRAKVILILGTDAHNFIMGERFGGFQRAIGHRLHIPRRGVTPSGLGDHVETFGKLYLWRY